MEIFEEFLGFCQGVAERNHDLSFSHHLYINFRKYVLNTDVLEVDSKVFDNRKEIGSVVCFVERDGERDRDTKLRALGV